MAMNWRVQNDTNKNLTVGSFGISDNMQARLRVPANQIRDLPPPQLTDGDRIFVAWDDSGGQIYATAVSEVDAALGSRISVQVIDNRMDVAHS